MRTYLWILFGMFLFTTINSRVIYGFAAKGKRDLDRIQQSFCDDFEDGVPDGWTPFTPSAWVVTLDEGDFSYYLQTAPADGDEYSTITGEVFGDFEMTANVKLGESSGGNLFILFQMQNYPDGYYLQFGISATVLYRTTGGPGTGVEIARNPDYEITASRYHNIRIVRTGSNIQVFGDGGLVLNLNDGTFSSGRIAIGSFERTAYFDDIEINDGCGTPVPPAQPTNLQANLISNTQIGLTWNDNSTNESRFRLERRVDSGSYFFLTNVGANVTNYTDYVNPNTTYTYRIRAENSAGNSVYETSNTIMTPPAPDPPASPTNVVATANSSRQVELSWNDNSDNEDEFRIDRKQGSGNYTFLTRVPANTETFLDNGVIPNTTYMYRVRAENADGVSNFEQSNEVMTPAEPPAAPQDLQAVVGDGEVTLTWTANSEADFLRYRVYMETSPNPTTVIDSLSGSSNTTVTIKGLENGTTYYFRITAVNTSLLESAFSNPVSATPMETDVPPSAPQNLSGAAGDERATLTWNANTELDFLRYRVYRDTSPNPTAAVDSVDGAENTTITVTDLTNGVTYYFRITAVDMALQESGFSNQINLTPNETDLPPAAPQALQATVGDREVTLNWNQNSESDFLRYRIYGGRSPNSITQIDSVDDRGTTSRVISDLANGTTYFFRLTAVDLAFNESNFSNEVSATPRDVSPPILSEPSFPDMQDLNTAIPISVTATDSSSISEVNLLFREGGRSEFDDSVQMAANGEVYSAEIPASFVGTRGVEFMVRATDAEDNAIDTGVMSVQVRLPENAVQRNHGGGIEQNAYRLISFPLNTTTPTVEATLFDDLGQPDTLQWRLWDVDPSNAEAMFPFREFPDVGNLAAGQAKFLITRENVTLTSESGITVRTTEPFEIFMRIGWNMFSSPFNFDIPLQNVEPENFRNRIYTYRNGVWIAAPDLLEPGEGYMIKLNTSDPRTLRIHPSETISTESAPFTLTQPEWQLQISASCRSAVDNFNFVGVASEAAEEWDSYERHEPPPIGNYVSLVFPRRDWQSHPDLYTTDFRPAVAEGETWTFQVTTNQPGEIVTLSFDNVYALPAYFQVRLLDLDLSIEQDLRQNPTYYYRAAGHPQPRQFALLVGEQEFVDMNEHRSRIFLPDNYELTQNFPNPFNPSTTIKFGLPQPDEVSLKIYNIRGKEIATLVDHRYHAAGQHAIVWDAHDNVGRQMASGVYFYILTVGNEIKLQNKMTLLK